MTIGVDILVEALEQLSVVAHGTTARPSPAKPSLATVLSLLPRVRRGWDHGRRAGVIRGREYDGPIWTFTGKKTAHGSFECIGPKGIINGWRVPRWLTFVGPQPAPPDAAPADYVAAPPREPEAGDVWSWCGEEYEFLHFDVDREHWQARSLTRGKLGAFNRHMMRDKDMVFVRHAPPPESTSAPGESKGARPATGGLEFLCGGREAKDPRAQLPTGERIRQTSIADLEGTPAPTPEPATPGSGGRRGGHGAHGRPFSLKPPPRLPRKGPGDGRGREGEGPRRGARRGRDVARGARCEEQGRRHARRDVQARHPGGGQSPSRRILVARLTRKATMNKKRVRREREHLFEVRCKSCCTVAEWEAGRFEGALRACRCGALTANRLASTNTETPKEPA